MEKINPVVHFEMPAEDRNRMAVFYANAFGWKTKMLAKVMGNYTIVNTIKINYKFVQTFGCILQGGFYPKNDEIPNQCTSLVIGVKNI